MDGWMKGGWMDERWMDELMNNRKDGWMGG